MFTTLHKMGRRLSNEDFNRDVGIGSKEHDFEFEEVISFLRSGSLIGSSALNWGLGEMSVFKTGGETWSAEIIFCRFSLIFAILSPK